MSKIFEIYEDGKEYTGNYISAYDLLEINKFKKELEQK
jgi:hypothetical protein